MGGAGSANAATTNQTSVSTNTITDSYNQAFTRVENLSDVGNVTISQPAAQSPITFLLGIGGFMLLFLFMRKKMK